MLGQHGGPTTGDSSASKRSNSRQGALFLRWNSIGNSISSNKQKYPGCTTSAKRLHKRRCAIWTKPSKGSSSGCNSRRKESSKARSDTLVSSQKRGEGWAVSD